jgi:Flp pilus assembly pilin Flp
MMPTVEIRSLGAPGRPKDCEVGRKRRLLADAAGATDFVEVLIAVGFVALLALGAVRLLGDSIEAKLDCEGQAIAGIGGAGGSPACGAGAALGGSDPLGGPSGQGTGARPDGPGGGEPSGQVPGGSNGAGGGDASGQGPGGSNGAGGGGASGQGPGGNNGAGAPGTQKDDSGVKVGGTGSGTGRVNRNQTSGERTAGGAPPKSAEEQAKDAKKTGGKVDAEVGVEKKVFEKNGAIGEKTVAGGSEKISGGFGKAEGTGFAKGSVKEGVAVGGKVEGKVSAVNVQGNHVIIGGIQEKHELDLVSVKGSLEGKGGIKRDIIGASVSGEAGANVLEVTVEGKKVIRLPFTSIGLEIGGSGSAAAGANIGGEATGGFFKGPDGKSRVGVKVGFKAALGLGLGGKLSLNLIWSSRQGKVSEGRPDRKRAPERRPDK